MPLMFLIDRPLSPADYCLLMFILFCFFWTCIYEIYSEGGALMYIYCMVCNHVSEDVLVVCVCVNSPYFHN